MRIRKGLSVTELEETLKRMESKIDVLTSLSQQNNQLSKDLKDSDSRYTAFEGLSSPYNCNESTLRPSDQETLHGNSPRFIDTSRILEELSLSQQHSTAPQHLLNWPCCSLMIPDMDLQYPMQLEITRSKLSPPESALSFQKPPHLAGTVISQLSLSQMTTLVQSYFEHFHPSCLALDESKFYSSTLPQAMQTSFSVHHSTCLTLLVFSLGSVAAYYSDEDFRLSETEDGVGTKYFLLACDMFRSLGEVNWDSIQCLLLMR